MHLAEISELHSSVSSIRYRIAHVNNRAAYAARRPRLRFFGRSRAARQSVVAHPICARNPSRIEALQPNQHIIRR
jgi:hypothetical protein